MLRDPEPLSVDSYLSFVYIIFNRNLLSRPYHLKISVSTSVVRNLETQFVTRQILVQLFPLPDTKVNEEVKTTVTTQESTLTN